MQRSSGRSRAEISVTRSFMEARMVATSRKTPCRAVESISSVVENGSDSVLAQVTWTQRSACAGSEAALALGHSLRWMDTP